MVPDPNVGAIVVNKKRESLRHPCEKLMVNRDCEKDGITQEDGSLCDSPLGFGFGNK